MSETPGSKLRAWRESKRWSQSRLASLIGVHQTTIGKWESGDRNPRPGERLQLAKLVGSDYFLLAADESQSETLEYENTICNIIAATDLDNLAFQTGIPIDLLRYFVQREAIPTSQQTNIILEILDLPSRIINPFTSEPEMSDHHESIGKRLRWMRSVKGISLVSLSQGINESVDTLMAAEAHPEFPWHKNEELAQKAANHLAISFTWLWNGEGTVDIHDMEEQPK